MPLRSIPVEVHSGQASATAEAATAVDVLREDMRDAELNAWADEAAERVLARFRKAHGLTRPVERSGFFTAKGG